MNLYKIKLVAGMVFSFSILLGCAHNAPVLGCLYTGVDHHIYDRSSGSSIGPGRPLKHAKSCSMSVIYLNYFFYGDLTGKGDLEKAMNKAGITKIASIDYSWESIAMAYYKECVEVYGE